MRSRYGDGGEALRVTGEMGGEVGVATAGGDLEELGNRDEFAGPPGGCVQDVGELLADTGGRAGPGRRRL